MANKVNKKTRKRDKQLKKVKQLIKVSDLSCKNFVPLSRVDRVLNFHYTAGKCLDDIMYCLIRNCHAIQYYVVDGVGI